MKFENGVVFTNENCIGCNKCISECAIFGANVSVIRNGRNCVHVDSKKCIHCGNCISYCSHNAREYVDDVDLFFRLLEKGEKISLIIAPSFYMLYEDDAYDVLGYLKSLGVDKIYDASFGAEICLWAHVKYIKENYEKPASSKAFITQTCPSVINAIEMNYPELIEKIVPVQSPSMCTAIYARNYLEDRNRFVFLGPCVAKKDEFVSKNTFGYISLSLTFSHLFKYLKEKKGKSLDNCDFKGGSAKPDLTSFGLGEIIPLAGGFKNAISHFFRPGEYIVELNGVNEENMNLLKNVSFSEDGSLQPVLVDFLSCEHGCQNGPGTEKAHYHPESVYYRYAKNYKEFLSYEKITDYNENYNFLEKTFANLNLSDFKRSFEDRTKQVFKVPDNILDEIFNAMLKNTNEKRNINCGFCGYSSCRQMMNAIALGYNKKENCIKYMNELMQSKLYFDSETESPNKAAFIHNVSKLLDDNPEKIYIICSGNINRYRVINDLYGSRCGDEVLKIVARQLEKIVSPDGFYARIANDQFALCIEDTVENIEKIRSLQYFDCSEIDVSFPVTMRFGLYITEHIKEENVVMFMVNCATLAMNKRISTIYNTYSFFTADLRENLFKESSISSFMKPALKNKEFVLWFQPQYSAFSNELVGAESLCRWIKADDTVISPSIFIPIAEKNGFINYLDKEIWKMAFATMRRWLDEGLSPVPLSVNISRVSLASDSLIYVIKRLQDEFKIPCSLIHFEVTESAYINDQENFIERISKIRKMGFLIAMDDFGSGYSSLNSLKDMPIDILKLDMGFLRSSKNLEKGGCIISSVIKMAQSLELVIIAEGVESLEQAKFLKSLGCNVIQGFYYAKPMSEDRFREILSSDNKCAKIEKSHVLGKIDVKRFNDPNSAENIMFENYSGPAAFFEFNAENESIVILKTNEKLQNMIGLSKMTKVDFQSNLNSFFKKDNGIKFIRFLKEAIKSKKEENIMLEACNFASGKRMYIKAHVWEVSEIGKNYNFFVLLDDITKEKTVNENLKLSYRQLDIMMEKSQIGICLLNVSMDVNKPLETVVLKIIKSNEQFSRMFGFSEEYILSLNTEEILSFIHKDDMDVFVKAVVAAVSANFIQPGSCVYRGKCKSGEYQKVRAVFNGGKQTDTSFLLVANFMKME